MEDVPSQSIKFLHHSTNVDPNTDHIRHILALELGDQMIRIFEYESRRKVAKASITEVLTFNCPRNRAKHL